MKINPYEHLIKASSIEQLKELQQLLKIEGYSYFRRILDGLKDQLKAFTDDDIDDFILIFNKAKQCVPQPGRISPAWETIWSELEQIMTYKIELLQSIPLAERVGEWQIIMDNPYTNQEVVCYPNLTFLDAAYLYGYFRPLLEKNEYIQVQKVQNILTVLGSQN